MALFKPFRGTRATLDSKELHDGYAYFCTDDGSFHIDYVDKDGNLQRKQINAKDAETLMGMSLDEIKAYVATQSDWNQSDETAIDYIKNRTHYEIYKNLVVVPVTEIQNRYSITLEDTSAFEVGKKCVVTIDGTKYETTIRENVNMTIGTGVNTYDIGIGSWMSLNTSPAIVRVVERVDDCPFALLLNDNSLIFAYETTDATNDVHAVEVSVESYELHKLDEKYIPGMHIKEINKDGNMTNEEFLALENGVYFMYGSPLDCGHGLVGVSGGYWNCYDYSYYYGGLHIDGENLVADDYGTLDGFGTDEAMYLISHIFPNDITEGQTVVASFDELGNPMFKAKDYSEQVQVDWNSNDVTNISHIKNRPFYAEREVVFENLNVTGNLLTPYLFENELTLKEGALYYTKGTYSCNRRPELMNVEFEGTYKCVNGEVAIFPYENNGEPVLIVRPNQVYIGLGNNYDDASAVFYTLEELTKYHKIDEAYIPDTIARVDDIPAQAQPDWEQSDETALDYIKNRPFYSEVVNNTSELTINEQSSDGGTSTDTAFAKLLYENYTSCVYEVFNGNAWYVGNIDSVETTSAYLVIEISCPLGSGNTLGHTVKIAHDYSSINWIRATELSGSKIRFAVTVADETVHQIEQKYIPNTIATKDYVQSFLPKMTTVTIPAANWTGDSNPWSQVVTINGVTANSKVDLQPTAYQIVELQNADIALMTENNNGVVTVYALGGKPTVDYTMQVLMAEVAFV